MRYEGVNGQIYTLGNQLDQGAEGVIYDLQNQDNMVAKIYHPGERSQTKKQKLSMMIGTSPILEKAAWPKDIICSSAGEFVGYVMPKIVDCKQINRIYASNEQIGNLKFRLAVAHYLCDAIDEVHQIGHVCGDLQPNNILVSRHGLVTLVDTDSFHIENKNNPARPFRCDKGVSEFIAPELQPKIKNGQNLKIASLPTFTQETDSFALAVYIFELFMNGCHPFATRYDDITSAQGKPSVPNPQPIDHIEKGESPFFMTLPRLNTPTYAPPISSLPTEIQSLFRRAFIDGHQTPKSRPTCREWAIAIEKWRESDTATQVTTTPKQFMPKSVPPFPSAIPPDVNKPYSPQYRKGGKYKYIIAAIIILIVVILGGSIVSRLLSNKEAIPTDTAPAIITTEDTSLYLDQVIIWKDTSLEKLIRGKTNMPHQGITPEDLEYIYEIEICENDIKLNEELGGFLEPHGHNVRGEITTISDFNYFPNLRVLKICGQNISDLTSIDNSPNLYALSLYDNPITDVSPLASLTNLEYLICSSISTNDFSSFSPLTGLKELYLFGNDIEIIDFVAEMTSLEKLDLGNNKIVSIDPIQDLYSLRYLWLQHNNMEDISPISYLYNLEYIWLWENPFIDAAPLTELSIKKVYMDRGKVSNWLPYSHIEYIDARDN